jgi:hypothetical protein
MAAQIVDLDRRCVVCRQPMAGTAVARRGRPQRTHAGRCKRVADAKHRQAARLERFADRLARNGATTIAEERRAAAARIRAALGELPRGVRQEEDARDLLRRARAVRMRLAIGVEVNRGA